MQLSKKQIQEKIALYENQIKDLQDKVKGLRFTLNEFFPPLLKKQSGKRKPSVDKGTHPRLVKELLRRHPEGLTAKAIQEKLKTELGHEIGLPTLSSVFNRDKGRTFSKQRKRGREFIYTLIDQDVNGSFDESFKVEIEKAPQPVGQD